LNCGLVEGYWRRGARRLLLASGEPPSFRACFTSPTPHRKIAMPADAITVRLASTPAGALWEAVGNQVERVPRLFVPLAARRHGPDSLAIVAFHDDAEVLPATLISRSPARSSIQLARWLC
jgi:hypothetical protein